MLRTSDDANSVREKKNIAMQNGPLHIKVQVNMTSYITSFWVFNFFLNQFFFVILDQNIMRDNEA